VLRWAAGLSPRHKTLCRGARTVCITSFPSSPTTHYANIPLITAEQANAIDCAEALESTTVKIGQIAVLDMRYSAYAIHHHRDAVHLLAELIAFDGIPSFRISEPDKARTGEA
jgi:DNA-binding MurR/RpiR family transcriptional regulator